MISAVYFSITKRIYRIDALFSKGPLVRYVTFSLGAYVVITTLHRFYHGGPIRIFVFALMFVPYFAACKPFSGGKRSDILVTAVSALCCTSAFHYIQREVWPYYATTSGVVGLCVVTVLIVSVVFWLTMYEREPASAAVIKLTTGVAVAVAAADFLLLSANVRYWVPYLTITHHWGVFINAAERVTAGFVPLFDFPLQYGFGPLVMTLVGCRLEGCWTGFYAASTILSFLYFAAALLVLRMSAPRIATRGWAFDTVVALLATTLWIGVPWEGFQAIPIPSVGGVRFLPLAAMVVALFAGSIRASYAILALSAWWSPEAILMNTILLGGHELFRLKPHQAILRVGGAIAAAAALFVAVYFAIWHVFPDPLAYLEYLIHVPGPMPPAVDGSMWMLFGAFLLAIYCLATETDSEQSRRHLITLYALLAASLYCLGRSHSQNFINIMPFMVFVAYRFFGLAKSGRVFLAIRGQIVTLLFLGAVFVHWPDHPWNNISYDAEVISQEEATMQTKIVSALTAPTKAAIMVTGRTGITLQQAAPKWMPLDAWASYRFIPPERRNIYLSRWISRHPAIPGHGCYIFEDPDLAEPPSLPAYGVIDGFEKAFVITSDRRLGRYRFVGLSIRGREEASDGEACAFTSDMKDIVDPQ